MASTGLADIIKPQVLGKQVAAKFPSEFVLANTGAVFKDPDPLIAKGGDQLTIPRWKRISKFTAFTGAALTTGKVEQVPEYGRVVRRAGAWEVEDVATLVARDDPTAEIKSQLARRTADAVDDAGVAVLKGAIPSANKLDVSVGTGSKAGKGLNGSTLARAQAKLGDQAKNLRTLVVHSQVYQDMVARSLIQFAANGEIAGVTFTSGEIPTFMGKIVVQSDGCPLDATTPGFEKYTSYLLAADALYLGYQRMVNIETDRDILKKTDVLSADLHFIIHLMGMSFTGTPASGHGPTDAELATTGNWTLAAEDAKSVWAVALTTNTEEF